MLRFAIGLVVVLAACTQTVADQAVTFCHPLCRCIDIPLPGEQRECVDGCIQLFERDPLASSCVDCVLEHADRCPTLLDDCNPICSQNSPLESYRGRNESGIEDR